MKKQIVEGLNKFGNFMIGAGVIALAIWLKSLRTEEPILIFLGWLAVTFTIIGIVAKTISYFLRTSGGKDRKPNV